MKKNSFLITARVPIGAHFLIIGLVLALFALFTTSPLWADDPPVAAANAAQTTRATAEARAAYANLPLTGLHNGLPVSFTMVAINYGDVAPGVFNLTLSDGYTFIGTIVDGTIDIQ